MAIQNAIFLQNLSTTFDIGVIESNKINVKIDGTLVKNADGSIGLSGASLTVVSADAGNIIIAGTDGKAYLDQAAIQAVETAWTGTETNGFLTITPGGTNGHAVVYGFDWTNAAFVEAVQDAIGAAALAGAGITYDDVSNAISTNLGNITFGDGLNYDSGTNTVSVQYSADAGNLAKASPNDNHVLVAPADITALATVDVCDAFGVHMFNAFP